MEIKRYKDHAVLTGVSDLSLGQTFDCGQCFRFDPDPAEGFSGVAQGRFVRFEQPSPDKVLIYCPEGDEERWIEFLSLDVDYSEIKRLIASGIGGVMSEAVLFGGGIRILRQEPWEALCSFIISQNNNIGRIKKIISRLCALCGEAAAGAEGRYAFPSPAAVCALGEEGLAPLKAGFRAGYIHDAARRVSDGRLDLEALKKEETPALMERLRTVKGVGPKVAACAALFGFGRTEAFPVDVWVRRSLDRHFGGSLDISALGSYAGIAQQYLFYYERNQKLA